MGKFILLLTFFALSFLTNNVQGFPKLQDKEMNQMQTVEDLRQLLRSKRVHRKVIFLFCFNKCHMCFSDFSFFCNTNRSSKIQFHK